MSPQRNSWPDTSPRLSKCGRGVFGSTYFGLSKAAPSSSTRHGLTPAGHSELPLYPSCCFFSPQLKLWPVPYLSQTGLTRVSSHEPGCARQSAQSSAVPSTPAVETSCKSLDLLGLLYPCVSSCSCHKSREEGLEGPLNRPPASSRRKRPSTWSCLLCVLPARSPSITGGGGRGRSHHRLTRASGKWGTRGMQGHGSAGSGLRVSCPLPPVVGAVAFRYTEAAVPQIHRYTELHAAHQSRRHPVHVRPHSCRRGSAPSPASHLVPRWVWRGSIFSLYLISYL